MIDDEPDADADVGLVRPYSRTRGRTRSVLDLAIEALVSTNDRADSNSTNSEHQPIVDLCRDVRSVAEVAALLDMPLGVARILVADMAELGLVSVHATMPNQPPIDLLERVLAGLRKL